MATSENYFLTKTATDPERIWPTKILSVSDCVSIYLKFLDHCPLVAFIGPPSHHLEIMMPPLLHSFIQLARAVGVAVGRREAVDWQRR